MKLINVMYYEVSPTAVYAYENPVKITDYGLIGDNMHSIPPALVETKEPGIYNADGVKINPENYKEPSEWLPRNLREDWVYAAMNSDGSWMLFAEGIVPVFVSPYKDWIGDRFTDLDAGLFQTYSDPQGAARSLHKRVEGRWERWTEDNNRPV